VEEVFDEYWREYLRETVRICQTMLGDSDMLDKLYSVVISIQNCFQRHYKVMVAGNGGSAADAQHFAAELVGRFRLNRMGLPAIALSTDTSIITAVSNDYNFNEIFSRQIEALGKQGDVFVGISTSGNSENVVRAVQECTKIGITTICLLGNDGGKLKGLADISLIIPSSITSKIQEMHIILLHLICGEVEKNMQITRNT